jgi:curved DNA-binding protein CbpA
MSSPPQQDPYKALGIPKDADLAAVKTAYRKLVLKCHPDKIQDPTLKAAKQDEFQKVQQAYELLSDDTRRIKYDDEMKLYELRKEMGRGGPPGQSPFDYEIRTAEPRSASFRSSPKETQRAYGQPSPRAYDEEPRASSFEEPLRARATKTTTYEERKRPTTRDGDRSRRSEEEREYERWTKDRERAMHGAAKKSRDKDRRKGAEEKFSRSAGAYVEDDDSEDTYRPRAEERSKARERWARATEKLTRKEKEMDELTEKANKTHINTLKAVQYMEAARRKAEPEMDSRPKPARRADTFHEPAYTVRYAAPSVPYGDDDDSPRRSSAARAVPIRRTSESIPVLPRPSGKERRTSYDRDAYIVEASPPSPSDPLRRKPPLQTHTSEPPILPSASRKEPHRSKTLQSEYVRRDSTTAPPPLSRASTFQVGDKNKSSSRGSNLKTQMHYGGDASDSDGYSPRTSARREPTETTRRYVYEKGRTVPLDRYRSSLREDNYENARERSESPRGTPNRSGDRPSLARSGGGGAKHSSYSRGYSSNSPEPIIREARPKMPTRDATGSGRGPYFGEVKYAPNYGPQDVHYSPDGYRRGSDPTHHRDFAYPSRSSRETAYA